MLSLIFFYYLFIYIALLRLTRIHWLTHLFIFVFYCLFFCSLSIRRIHLQPVLYNLMSPSLRYVSFLSSFFFFSFAHISFAICPWFFQLPFSIIISYGFLCSSFFPPFFFLSSRISPSLSPYTTPRLRRFLPPWEVSLMRLM